MDDKNNFVAHMGNMKESAEEIADKINHNIDLNERKKSRKV
jgi:hypothetical protein